MMFTMFLSRSVARATFAIMFAVLLRTAVSSAAEVQISTVLVGNPGNAPDKVYAYNNPDGLAFGSVDYEYRIGTYEVTNAQYVAFLNAKAKTSDPLLLYEPRMGSEVTGGILRTGSEGNYTYTVKANMADKPVTYVNCYDAYRFINWMSNGQGNGDTETGSYTFSGTNKNAPYPFDPSTIVRNPGANWYLPNEDEWYKAAFYDPRTAAQGGPAGDEHYWYFPTRSDSLPTTATANSVGNIANPGANVANVANYPSNTAGANWNGSVDGNLTTVGSAGPLSASYYGTYDQLGNAWEWDDTQFGETGRGLRGGGYISNAYNGGADLRNVAKLATGSYPWIGFRVGLAQIPGDANSNGFVDGVDYIAWAEHFLLTGQTWASGDFSGDGKVDGADYIAWSDHFRPVPSQAIAASAVPEPSSIILAGLAAVGVAVIGIRRRS